VIEAVVAPVLHRKDIPPDAASVVDSPIQISWSPQIILHTGSGLTTTVVEQDELHPFASVTVTV
jgi:hypothetical protein